MNGLKNIKRIQQKFLRIYVIESNLFKKVIINLLFLISFFLYIFNSTNNLYIILMYLFLIWSLIVPSFYKINQEENNNEI